MKILVTGADGFIGRHVVAAAGDAGHTVRQLVHRPGASNSFGTDRVVHDLRQPERLTTSLRDIDVVVHCAALLDGPADVQHAVTVGGTEHLLAAMDAAGVRHIVGLSTFALYDYLRIPAGGTLDERSPLDETFVDRAPYVRAKRAQEDLIREWGRDRRWRFTILRPGLVTGPGREWFHHLGMRLRGNRWICLAGSGTLPLTTVTNCAGAIVRTVESEAANGATLNVVDDHPPTRLDYLQSLAARTRPRPTVHDIPWGVLWPAAAVATAINHGAFRGRLRLPDVLRSASLHARCKPLRYSNAKLKEVLGDTSPGTRRRP